MTRELRVDLSDLHSLTVECGTCHTAMTYELSEDRPNLAECPVCGQKLEEQGRAVTLLRNLYRDLRQSQSPMFFRIAETLASPPNAA
jgi:hypothetical protein